MLFVAFAILISIGIALAVSADFGAVIGLTENQTGRLIPLVLILTLVASAVVGRRYRLGEIVGSLVIWLAIGAVLAVGYTFRTELGTFGNRLMGNLQPGVAMVDAGTGNVHVSRSYGGNFFVNTDVNGAEVRMIFDTGATAVVLAGNDARSAGIDTAALNYNLPVQTANGTGYAAPITIDRLSVGNITRNGVRAFVVQDDALDTSLLGMTFLETLSRFSVAQDSLEMHD